jgi:6-phosphogluconate dehydrogenase
VTDADAMQLGMVGMGRMGANLVRRLIRDGHRCVVYDRHPEKVAELADAGATGTSSLAELVAELDPPRATWVMVAAGPATTAVIDDLAMRLDNGDIVIDGGNSYYRDDVARAARLGQRGIHLVDVGTSGGVWGLERGYCLMIGGDAEIVEHLEPLFASLAPGVNSAPRTPGRTGSAGPAEHGYLHCGPVGAGHFVKMVHNGIEYGLMAAYAEGLNILRHAGVGSRAQHTSDVETAPFDQADHYRYELDLAKVAEVWRRGSVVGSWLLDLTAAALLASPDLSEFQGRVSDSGEGRWTSIAAVETGVPAPVLTAALYERFASRGASTFADQVLSAMRAQFGGHQEKGAGG